MHRRELLKHSAVLGLAATFPRRLFTALSTDEIPVAFVMSDNAVVIDFAGPWEVFSAAMPSGTDGMMHMPFKPYMVAETSKTIQAGNGMQIVPNYTFDNAPAPKIIVIPAQNDPSNAMIQWIRHASRTADLTMSVCTGALLLAKTGLLSGRRATTHHASCIELAATYPDIHVVRGVRFVDDGNIATSGGLSCGIDLAYHVVDRFTGRQTALDAAFNEEYQSKGWQHPEQSTEFAHFYVKGKPMCVVCGMTIDPKTAEKSVYQGDTYYFCAADHKKIFDAHPAMVLRPI